MMTERMQNEDQEHLDVEASTSDSSSITDGPICEKRHGFHGDGIISLKKEESEFIRLKHKFYTSIGSLAQYCTVVAVHKNTHSSLTGRTRSEAFRIYLRAMTEKRNGKPNVKSAWYGASRNEILQIINNGFGACGMPEYGGLFGFGLCLYPDCSAINSVLSSAVDGEGLRHVVFCPAILGNMEEVLPGSRQSFPSSEAFDSAVDNLESPKNYIIWYPNVNTHVLPLYVLSIKVDLCSKAVQREPVRRPSSPWIPLSALMSMLSKTLPPSSMRLIRRYHGDYMERKITRMQLIRHLRQLSGDKLLINAIKTFRDKQRKVASDSPLRAVTSNAGHSK